MDVSSIASPPLSTPLERLKDSLQRSVERSGRNSLYSRMLRAEITRHEALLRYGRQPCAARWNAQAEHQE